MDDRDNLRNDQGIWIPGSPPPTDAPAEDSRPAEEATVEAQPAEDTTVEDVDYEKKYLYALAETENVRRRGQEQQRLAVQRANEHFVDDLLPVIDSIDRGIAAAGQEATAEALRQGLDLVHRQLHTFLENHGIEPIVAEVGDEFDPEVHEAMMRQPASEEAPEGHIAAVLERGYRLNGRVIRATRVAVAAEGLDTSAG